MADFSLEGRVVDVCRREIFEGEVFVQNGIIAGIEKRASANSDYILPGLIDAHVHIESSMLVPSEFARLSVVHGTVAAVSDPHEIANACGIPGVTYMTNNAASVPFRFMFGVPSCVPATPFETTYGDIGADGVRNLFEMPEMGYLAEVMNFPGVLSGDDLVMAKIEIARRLGKPIDGHAPGLKGEDAARYAGAGISTDHECATIDEALDKIKCGMKILIREGSAAKNFEALIDLVDAFPDFIMFCSDDKHPDSLVNGHIDEFVRRAVERGHSPINVLRAATLNPARHYRIPAGLLQPGDPADMIVVNSLDEFNVKQTYLSGVKVAEEGQSLIETRAAPAINVFHSSQISREQIEVPAAGNLIRVIEVISGELFTRESIEAAKVVNGKLAADPGRDILKLVVVNRYEAGKAPAVAFVRNFGLHDGALASSVAHDSHNVIAVGADDEDLVLAINRVMSEQGGIAVSRGGKCASLPLPVGGLMSNADGYTVAADYALMDAKAKALGSKLPSPFMTLSFLALLVIPEIKLSDKGLFDGRKFSFIPLQP